MLSVASTSLKRAWGKLPAFIALLALVTSALVAVEVPQVAEAAGTSSCTTTNTYTASNGYCTVTFSTTGADSFTVPTNVDSIDLLLVGGGGGSNRGICSYTYGAGSGGGGVLEVFNKAVTAGTVLAINVGAGGTGTSAACSSWGAYLDFTSPSGGNTTVTTTSGTAVNLAANGGIGARTKNAYATGATSGSTSIDGVITPGFGGGVQNWDTSGACTQTSCANGGGGGAGAAGSGMNGGAGKSSTITGSSYGGGGASRSGASYGTASNGGTNASTTCDAAANSGGGASDCINVGPNRGGNGGSGIVVIRYLVKPTLASQPADTTVTTSPTRTATFSVGAVTTAASLTSPTVTYQWQESTDNGTTWSNVSTGSGGTTASYTTPVLSSTAKNGTKYRAKVTQTSGSVSNFTYSSVATLGVTTDAAAPGAVTAIGANDSELGVGWTAPTVNGAAVITGYSIIWSTTADFATSTTINTGSTETWGVISNLTANTTYYVKVYATGTGWTGTLSDAVSGTTKSATTTLDVNATSSSVEGTDYVVLGSGLLVSKTALSITLSVTALQNLLANKNITLSFYRININGAVSWSANTQLTLGTHYSTGVNLFNSITASGDTAGVKITPTAYYYWAGNAPKIVLSGANPSFKISSTSYTVVNTVAKLANVTATSKWVLGQSLNLTTSYSGPVLAMTFTGEFDGLGNTINNMDITIGSSGNYGFFRELGALAKVRNIGFANVKIRNSTAGIQKRIGAIAGASTGAPVTIERSWASGSIIETATTGNSEIGGLLGGATATGTTTITTSNSQVSIISGVGELAIGGILGSNVSTYASTAGTGGTVSITKSWNSGDIQRTGWSSTWNAIGGIMGAHVGVGASIDSSYNIGNVKATGSDTTTNVGGILGYSRAAAMATVTNTYTSNTSCGAGTITNCTSSVIPGTQIAALTAYWSKTALYGTYLNSNDRTTRYLFVKVVAPTNNAFSGVTYTLVDGLGDEVTSANLTSLNLSVSGTPTYTIDANTSYGDYQVSYVNGLTIGGSAAALYKLASWRETTSVTIGNAPQVITFNNAAPTGKRVGDTYQTAATSTSGLTVSYSVSSPAICSISGSTISFIAAGTCVVTADQAGSSAYQAATQVTQEITVGKGLQSVTITSTAPVLAVFGGSGYTPAGTGGNSGNAVTFTVDISSVGVCSIANGVVSYIGAGTCRLNADQAGNDNYEAATQAQQSFVVAKATQAISFTSTAPSDAVLGDTYTVAASGGASNNDVTFSIDVTTASKCSISGATITFLAAGTCKVNANQAGSSNYFSASQVQQSISVGKGSQAISFVSTAPTGVRVGDTGYDPTAVGGASSSSVSISVAAGSSGVCSISGAIVTFNAAGSCVLEANQAGDDNYTAAATVTQTIVVSKALQSITKTSTDPLDASVGGSTYTPVATGGNSGNSVVVTIALSSAGICSVTNGTISFTGAGNCEYILSQDGNIDYEDATPVTATISVAKATQTITFTSAAPSDAVVGGSTFTPTATGGGTGHAVNFWIALSSSSVCTLTDGVVSMVGVGTCLIQASQNGNNNYEAAPTASLSFLVGKGSQAIQFTSASPTNAVVGGAKYTPVATGGATGNSVTFSISSASSSICSITAGKVSFLTPGDCVIEANQVGNTNYYAAALATQVVSVAKGSQIVSFTSNYSSAKVGGNSYAPAAIGGASGQAVIFSIDAASSSICSIASGSVSFQAVGDCVINANQAGNSTYNAAIQAQQTISVAKGTQAVTFTSTPPHNAQVQGLSYTPTATSNNSGIAITFSVPVAAQQYCTIANGVVSFHAVGDCVLNADQTGNTNWTAATRVSQVFNVTKGQQTVTITSTAPSDAKVSGLNYDLTSTSTGGAGSVTYSISELSTGICSVNGSRVSFDATGDCVVVASKAGDSLFNPANPVTQTISVAKGISSLEFTTTPTSPKVDDTGYTPGLSVGFNTSHATYSTADASVCEFVSTKVLFHKAGSCTVYADQPGDANFEPATQISQTFTVAKGNQAPLIPHTSIDYLSLGDGNSPTTVLSLSGGSGEGAYGWSVNSNSSSVCSITDDVVLGLSVGTCQIDLIRLGDANYESVSGTLEIAVTSGNQAPVIVHVSNESATFAPGLELSMTLTGGAGDGAIWYASSTPEICLTDGSDSLQILHAGTCTIVGHKDGNSTYLAVEDSLTFTIAKASMTGVTIGLANSLTYSTTGPVSSVIEISGVTSTGAQNLAITQGTCTIENGSLVATEAGTCDVQLTVAEDQDYLEYSNGRTFTVAKAQQSNLTATRMSEAPAQISYVGTNTTTYEISGGSGTGTRAISIENPALCSASFQGDNLNVMGIAVGMCRVTVRNPGDANYAAASTTIEVRIYDLPDAPSALTVSNTGVANSDGMGITVGWTAPAANSAQIPLSGYQVQAYIDGAWTEVTGGLVASDVTSQTVRIPAWNTIKVRVAAVSPLDPSTDADRKWAYFTGTGPSDQPVEIKVPGELRLISTTVAAVTSGELVTLTGSGFEVGLTTQVELSSAMQVFTAGIHIAAVANRVVVPATVISETQLTFVLPKIKLPAGQTTLPTQVKVLSNTGIATLPATFNYIPKKLTQVMTVNPALPAATTVIDVGSPLTTPSVITSTGLAPVVTATPAEVCTAALNNQNRLVITPVSPGKCSISVQLPGTPGYIASAAKVTTVNIKQARSTEFMVAARDVAADGSLGQPRMFNQADTLLTPGEINVVLGSDPIDVQVGMQPREGTVVFKVDPADEAAGRCTADAGDQATTGFFGSIMITDIGDCHVTISNPAEAGWYQGQTIRLVVHATARPSNVTVSDNGEATLLDSSELAELVDPLDPDDPDTPPVAITLDPTRTTDYSFGTEDGLGFDPVSKKLTVKSRTPLVGTWTATLTAPNVNKKWFKIPGKIVKKVQTYTYSNVCKLTLTVKKDPKLKKKVTRLVGAGCLLTTSADKIGNVALADNGWAALNAVGIQKIKVKYKRIRQYANTGLSYRGTAKAKTRELKNINRTWVIRVGHN